MLTQKSAIDLVKNFVSDLINSGINLKEAFIFGSYSKNLQNEYSDIDVALIAEDFSGISFIDIEKLLPVLRNYYIIQPKTYSTKDYLKGDPFLNEIRKDSLTINFH
jgi:predicted nucleotidyltransferase